MLVAKLPNLSGKHLPQIHQFPFGRDIWKDYIYFRMFGIFLYYGVNFKFITMVSPSSQNLAGANERG